ncbi:L-ascorbate metabolism protein UlaG, beta-lactamase superfamily [Halobiforma haloterrestris]|uniref:L-ascorbate metabolism protein UlaG, beta-lactamase superfamily n=1 Tax=Natronobacterium haloterrestre TaxID=148448 RepID=A0A1I1HA09_NATHA|nr:MBL fold metallo-hydrolase [Halobiforma haloterrestris]SFC17950.1 L-ascorbate metabolism protein UlaG, beta-lactamase superfamily [Halobiforma haloterrestris]
MAIEHGDLTVSWLGYATARIEASDGTVVYTDPGRYGTLDGTWAQQYGGASHPSSDPYDARDGDLVVVTHDHHYDDDGIERVASEDATLVVYEDVSAERITAGGRDVVPREDLPYDVRRVAYGDELTVAGVDVEVVPAYNHPDGPNAPGGDPIHPEGFGCGFRLTVDGVPCFWTGDSDVIDAHDDLEVSLFLPSIAQNFTMDRHAAADLAERLAPDLVVPIHYNTFPDLEADSRAFAGDVASRGVPVVLDED